MYVFLTLPLKSHIKLSSCDVRGGEGGETCCLRMGLESKGKEELASIQPVCSKNRQLQSRFLFILDLFGLHIGNTNWRMTSFYISLEAVQNLLKSPKKQIMVSFFPLNGLFHILKYFIIK